jgi:hypothetical protein
MKIRAILAAAVVLGTAIAITAMEAAGHVAALGGYFYHG